MLCKTHQFLPMPSSLSRCFNSAVKSVRSIHSFTPFLPNVPSNSTNDVHLIPFFNSECKGHMDFCRDNEMNPPLFIAAQYNRIDMIERLLSAGHHINQQNYLGETALMFAARENKFRAVSTLLRWGAQFDIRDLEGTTAADFTLDREISTLITQYATLPPALIHSQQLKEDN